MARKPAHETQPMIFKCDRCKCGPVVNFNPAPLCPICGAIDGHRMASIRPATPAEHQQWNHNQEG